MLITPSPTLTLSFIALPSSLKAACLLSGNYNTISKQIIIKTLKLHNKINNNNYLIYNIIAIIIIRKVRSVDVEKFVEQCRRVLHLHTLEDWYDVPLAHLSLIPKADLIREKYLY